MFFILLVISIIFQLQFETTVQNFIGNSIDVDVLKYNIPCPLEWIEINNIHSPLVSTVEVSNRHGIQDLFNSYHTKKQIARTTILGQTLLGTFDGKKAYFYSSKSGRTVSKTKFELLTNPNECLINWLFSPNINTQSFNTTHFTFDLKNSSYVGRSLNSKDDWQVCTAILGKPQCHASKNGEGVKYENFQILQSITRKLSFKLGNFSFTERVNNFDLSSNGPETILNKANIDISSSLTYGTVKSGGIDTSKSTTITAGLKFLNAAFTFGSSDEENESEDIAINRELIVPALTSVETCSIQKLPKLEIKYTADASFFIPGIQDAEIVQDILLKEQFPGPFERNGNLVKTTITGEYKKLSGQASTEIDINPVNIFGSDNSCENRIKKFETERRERFEKDLTHFVKERHIR